LKSLLLILVAFHSLLAFDYTLEPKNVNAATYCFFGLPEVMNKHNNGNMSNSCFVDMGTSYLVIDSGPTYQYAQQAYKKMQKIKNLPVSYVINTHIHDDHWLGNSYYTTLGAKIIGSDSFEDETPVEMTRMQKRISPEAFQGTTQVFPSIFVKKEQTLHFKDVVVKLIRVNTKAHTNGDLLVYIPAQRTIFVGDIVFNERLPSIRDGDLSGWLEALDMINKLDVDFIIGGHGTLVSKDSTKMTYKYIKTLRDEVAKLLDEGYEIGEVVNLVKMEEFKDVNFYDSMHRQNVEIAYRMLEWESE